MCVKIITIEFILLLEINFIIICIYAGTADRAPTNDCLNTTVLEDMRSTCHGEVLMIDY